MLSSGIGNADGGYLILMVLCVSETGTAGLVGVMSDLLNQSQKRAPR